MYKTVSIIKLYTSYTFDNVHLVSIINEYINQKCMEWTTLN
jgi:hypothetical protein